MIHHKSTEMMQEVQRALAALVDVRAAGDRALVSVPVQYPSGALSVIEIERHNSTWWVSDMGHGLQEAEYVSAGAGYARAAATVAKAYGVKFDGQSIFALMVPEDRLDAGIVAVSNASANAAVEAIRSESERKFETKEDLVFDRLCRIFNDLKVVRKMEIAGEHASWEAHNVVRLQGSDRAAIFEVMTQNSLSVASKYLMFSDLRSKPNLILNAVVSDPDKLDSKGRMIDDVATIVRIDAADATFRRLAAFA